MLGDVQSLTSALVDPAPPLPGFTVSAPVGFPSQHPEDMSRNVPQGRPGDTPEDTDGMGSSYTALPNGRADVFADEEDRAPDLTRLWAAVRRHRWAILAVTVLGTGGGVLAARAVPNEYEVQSTIWIEAPNRGEAGPIRASELLRANAWVELLRSYVVLDYVVMEEKLYLRSDPAEAAPFHQFELAAEFSPGHYRLRVDGAGTYTLSSREGYAVESGRIGDSIGTALGFRWSPSPAELRGLRDVEFEVKAPREAAIELNESLRTQIDQSASFLRLELRGRSPEKIAAVLNTLGERYIAVAANLKKVRLEETTAELENQLGYAQRNLEEAERELQTFQVRTITLPADRGTLMAAGVEMTRDPVFRNFFEMKVELEQVRRDREAIERALVPNSGGAIGWGSLEVIPAVRESSRLLGLLEERSAAAADLRALLRRYTDEHPPVQELRERVEALETVSIPEAARALLAEMSQREALNLDRIALASQELEEIPPRSIEEARLGRAAATAEALYRDLRSRLEESRLAVASAMPDVQILDRATVPRSPVSDQKPRIVLIALLGSLGLALVGALVRDRLDTTLRYADQITRDMGLGVLGAVPELHSRRGIIVTVGVTEAVEAFRSLRLNLMHAHGSAGPVAVTVSSPGVGDGKSFVSVNLGLSFARLGKRVLIIDGDVRRGVLHEMLEVERKPGLTDYLEGSANGEEILRRSAHERLDVLPRGKASRAGPELIGSAAMRDLLLGLRSRYDVILVDTAPLGAGIEPYVFGTLTGGLLLVLRTGRTNRDLAEAKLEMLNRLPIRLLGTVVNGISERDSGYYYHHAYYSYLPGYELEDEPETEPQPLQEA